jgi:hypothetical protein
MRIGFVALCRGQKIPNAQLDYINKYFCIVEPFFHIVNKRFVRRTPGQQALRKADIKKAPASALRRELRVRAGAQKGLQVANSQPFQNRIHNTLCVTVFCVCVAN